MKRFDHLNYKEKIIGRIRILWLILFGMLAYLFLISGLGGENPRIMTELEENTSRFIYFGGLIYVIYSIIHNKKFLQDRELLKEQMQIEEDERKLYLHDKSGGIVLDILLVLLLFMTCTTAFFHTIAFYTSASILAIAILIKVGAYFIYSHF